MRFGAWQPAVVVILVAVGVGAGFAMHARADSPRVTAIRVTERDFHIFAPKHVASGDVDMTVVNKGPDDHELIIVRARNIRLPLRSDGITVNEEQLEPETQPSLEPGPPGSVRTFRLHLRPGYYVLFCNMAGHFMAGMHATLAVS